MILGDLLSACLHRQFHTLPGLLVGLHCQTPTLAHCVPCREAVYTIFMMVFGMTRPGGELTTYRVRGGHANLWANPTRSCIGTQCKLIPKQKWQHIRQISHCTILSLRRTAIVTTSCSVRPSAILSVTTSKQEGISGGRYVLNTFKNERLWLIWGKHNREKLIVECETIYSKVPDFSQMTRSSANTSRFMSDLMHRTTKIV